ncbi:MULTISPECIES: type II toxin-antitoxin system RelE/ParE family toxin [Novosphingobium]|uniref:DUF3617 domain-containing protein n=1 Tax=Novosphingobium TaxID=165696 RepID=UPI001F37D6AE|nr:MULTISPECIES: type II toxin-antitoxin system RelE/ParE family toxin [Novosphingobium]
MMKAALGNPALIRRSITLCGFLIAGFAAASGLAQGPAMAMLDRIEPGMWEVRARDEAETFRICVDSGRELIQIRHQGETCRRFIVDDTPGLVTVHYTCPTNGYGHTSLRLENARLIRLDTQGIRTGLPFNFTAEARRIGPCR